MFVPLRFYEPLYKFTTIGHNCKHSHPTTTYDNVVDQVANNAVEFLVPKVVHLWKSYAYRYVASVPFPF